MITLRNNTFYIVFIAALLSTEFSHIDVFGGSLRLYHFMVPVVIILLHGYLPYIAKNSTFWALIGFLMVNVVAATFSASPIKAFSSLCLLSINMSIAFAVALILVSGRLQLDHIVRIVFIVTVVSVICGIVQVAVYKFTGVNLGLSLSQSKQIVAGFSSGLRTEANTFAKYLNVVLLLLLPSLLVAVNWRRSLLITAILLAGILMSFTRSSLYGLSITLLIMYVWYLLKGNGRLIAPRALTILGLASGAVIIFTIFASQFNEYAAYKIVSFFDSKEILEGGSSRFRLMSQQILWDAFVVDDKSMLLGNGWGQVRFYVGDQEWQAGGAEIVLALSYGGVFSGLLYLLYQIAAIKSAGRMVAVTSSQDPWMKIYEGVLFALIGLFITGQINGALIAPEYWLIYGIVIYFNHNIHYSSSCRYTLS